MEFLNFPSRVTRQSTCFTHIKQVATLAILAVLLFIPRFGLADGKFIPAADRTDIVYDDARQVLYISAKDQVLRYDLAAQEFLSPVYLGGYLQGIDISPDGDSLAVANAHPEGGFGITHIIDLITSAVKKVKYPIELEYAEGPYSVAYGADGGLLIATGAQWGNLYRYDPQTEAVTVIASSFRYPSMLCASADRSVIGIAEGDSSGGPVGRYRVSDGDLLRTVGNIDGTASSNYEIGVNRNGTQYAIPTYNGTFIYDQNLVKTEVQIAPHAVARPMGLVYSPIQDIVYFTWSTSTNIYAYDTKTFTVVDVYDFENRFDDLNRAYQEGRLKISKDGKLLFGTVEGGVRYIEISAPPVAQPQSVTVDEDSQVSITLQAVDPEGAPVQYSIVQAPTNGTLTGQAPQLLYTPTPDFAGVDSFVFTASDGNQASTPTMVNITVTGYPDAPWAEQQSVSTMQDTPIQITLHATDAEGDLLNYQVSSLPAHGTITGAAPNIKYTPANGYLGQDSFQFVASDGQLASAPGTIVIQVEPRNNAPVANPIDINTSRNKSVHITLTADNPDNLSLEFLLKSLPVHGTLSGQIPNLIYTPEKKFEGTDSFQFKVEEGTRSSVATVTITVSGKKKSGKKNQRPVAHNQTITTTGDAVSIILTGESEIEGTMEFQITKQPKKGTLTGVAPNLIYIPGPDFKGKDQIKFRVVVNGIESKVAKIKIVRSKN